MAVTPKNNDKKIRFTEHIPLSGNTPAKTTSSTNVVSNTPVLSSTGVNLLSSASGSQPQGNTKNDRIQRTPSQAKKNKLEDHHRTIRPSLNKNKSVVDTKSISFVTNSKLNVNADLKCATWQTFTLVGNVCPLTRIVTTAIVPLREPIPIESNTDKPVVTLVYSRKSKAAKKKVPVSIPTINKSLVVNETKPKNSWGSTSSNVPSSRIECSENLRKLQPKADIGIFIGYAPTKKAFRIYNRYTRRIIETIHVDFDELTIMAYEQSSSGPALNETTPETISLGLVQKSSSSTPYVPPSRNDWDLLFQPMFDELLNPPPSVDPQAPKVIASIAKVIPPVQAESTDLPSSTLVDQDAPLPSKSQTTPETQSAVIPQDVKEDNLDIEVAHMGNDPLFGVPIPEVTSTQSSQTVSPHTIMQPDHQILQHISKWTKDDPLYNIIVQADSTSSPSSTTVDQDAPSPSKSQTTPETQSTVIPQHVEEDNTDIKVAHIGNDPLFGVPILE
nr:hypothetical protein [Tanacetum cinerariifolium]